MNEPRHSDLQLSDIDTSQKVLLIQPPVVTCISRVDMNPNVPLGLAYIAAVLEKEGYRVKIIDSIIEGWDIEIPVDSRSIMVGLSFESIKKKIIEESPDIVGITSMFTCQRKSTHEVARLVKSVNPNIQVIVGGAHPSSSPEMVLKDRNIDYIVLGEGENTIVPLLKTIQSNGNLAQIDGIGYMKSDGKPVIQPKNTFIENLDEIPFPARHLLPMEKYFTVGVRHGGMGKARRATALITSRGCPYKCNFCTVSTVSTKRTRMRSVGSIIAELETVITTWNLGEVYFLDDQILAKRQRALDLFEAMAKKFQVSWDAPNGMSPWLLDEEMIAKMSKSGCTRVSLAVESGSQEVLDKIINKPVKVSSIPQLVSTIHKHNMSTSMFLVVGNISEDQVETMDQIYEGFSLARRINVVPHVSYMTAYPGSEAFRVAISKGYLIPNFSWDDLTISKLQLQTPMWDEQQLKSVVDREIAISRQWLNLTSLSFKRLLVLLKDDLLKPQNLHRNFDSIFGIVRIVIKDILLPKLIR